MSLRVCVAVGVLASLAAGAVCGLAYYAGNLLAELDYAEMLACAWQGAIYTSSECGDTT